MDRIRLSVIVITYNQEDSIAATIESILSQVPPQSTEILVGDDCSSDGTDRIVREFAERYPAVIRRHRRERNLGAVGNYLELAKACRGEIIMQCAGDDEWLPGKAQAQLELLDSDAGIGMTYSRASAVTTDGRPARAKVWGGPGESFDELLRGNVVPAPTAAFRRTVLAGYLESVEPEKRGWLMEDYPLWLWCALTSKIRFSSEIHAKYRVASDSVSRPTNLDKLEAFQRSFIQIRHHFAELAGRPFSGGSAEDDMSRWKAYNRFMLKSEGITEAFDAIKRPKAKDRAKRLIFTCPGISTLYRLYLRRTAI